MAIFGMNGLYAAGLYFGLVFAVYSTRSSGFKNSAQMDSWWRIAQRKSAAIARGKGQGQDASYATERQKAAEALVQADPRVAAQLKGKAGQAYAAQKWLR